MGDMGVVGGMWQYEAGENVTVGQRFGSNECCEEEHGGAGSGGSQYLVRLGETGRGERLG